MNDCVFCDIVNGAGAASVAYEDDLVLAVMDFAPVNPGHTLIIPREHAVGLGDLSEAVGSRVWLVGHRIGRALRSSGLRCEGVNMFLADGKAASQEVFHFHLHVFPRFRGDGFRIDADWTRRDRSLLDQEAEAINAGLGSLGAAGPESSG